MHPLAVFPTLLSFGLIVPLLLRLTVGLFVLNLGAQRWKKPYQLSALLYVISGLMLVLGYYTQVVAIVAIAILKLDFYLDFWKNRKTNPIPKNSFILYWIVGIILLSLIVTGPGLFSLDLPL